MKQQTTTTALYCRLSKDDLINGDSMSIQNQKELLGNYASQNGFPITEFYVDDGYSGTNFERPSFKRMISDIEDGRIGTVIVKDLSRLGREYLQTGYYTEMFFPQNDVRFIAINDNVDSNEGYNDFATKWASLQLDWDFTHKGNAYHQETRMNKSEISCSGEDLVSGDCIELEGWNSKNGKWFSGGYNMYVDYDIL